MAELRVATLNLLHGMSLETGRCEEPTLRAAAAALDADVVGLQEVDRGQPRSAYVDQTRVVAEVMGAMALRFEPSLRGTPEGGAPTWTPWHDGDQLDDRPAYGVALLSRVPVLQWHVRRFPAARMSMPLLVPAQPRPRLMRIPDEPRVALAAVLDMPGGPMTVVTTHLSFVPGVNVAQLRAVARWARTMPEPRLILGDLNLPGGVPSLATGWERLGRGPTYPSFRPRVQFDHVLGDGISRSAVVAAAGLRLPVSDHCGVRVTLAL